MCKELTATIFALQAIFLLVEGPTGYAGERVPDPVPAAPERGSLTSREVTNLSFVARLPTTSQLTAIANWLSAEFGLPEIRDLPRIAVVSELRLQSLRMNKVTSATGSAAKINDMHITAMDVSDVVALYVDVSRTIYLRQGWNTSAPSALSVVVHEMVHHLQNVAEMKFACPQAREKLAYDAQDRWLAQFGMSLEGEFGIDAMTRLVRGTCAM